MPAPASRTGTPHDRSLLLEHAERPQDHDVSRGDRAEIQDLPDQYRQGRAVQAGVSGGGAEQPHPRHGRSRAEGLYLAEKTGKFLPTDFYGRYDAIQWTFWQMGGLGPMAGQNHHFRNYAQEKIKYAIDRYVNETNRLYGVLNKRLKDREFVAGDYSIADMASYPWIVPYKNQEQNIDDFPHLKRWLETIRERPATVRAYALAKEVNPNFGQPVNRTEEERKVLFGQTAAVVK
jgi:hypothetical protein